MPKTLQITGDSPYGGGGYLILRWCKYLISKGWQVHVQATNPQWLSMLKEIPDLLIINDIYIPRCISPLKDCSAFFQLLRLMKKEKYNVVHTYTATPSFLGRIAARIVAVPIILHHQAGWTVTEFSSMWKKLIFTPLEYLAIAASTKDICVSNAVKQQGRDLRIAPLNKLVVVRNGIDPTPFITAAENGARVEFRNKMGYLDGQLVIGNTGRLAQQKDNKTLIESMAIFKARNPQIPFVLLLAGDGPDRKALEDLTVSLKLTDEVRFLGFVSNIPQFLAGLDIFISPSLWEGLSISLLEAMAAAKPIITTSILPNAELIKHEVNGLIVSPRQPEQIAEALLRLVQDTQLAKNCAAVARKDVLENFTIDRMFEETLELYY